MDAKDPRLIMTLEALSQKAEGAWNRLQNRDRCLPASEFVVEVSSRESTPAVDSIASQIQLGFNNKPKDLQRGFVFGSDLHICDVFLGERGTGFSGRHFCITFNERGEVIFNNTSRKEVQVDYNGEDPSRRNQFTWILFDTYENIKVTLGKDLIFKIKWPDHDNCRAEYTAHRDAYLEEHRNALPPFSQLGMESQPITAVLTAQQSPRHKLPGQASIYLLEEELGHGTFGTVHKAVDVSTGEVHAAKQFHHGDWKREVDILISLSHVSGVIDLKIIPCLTFFAKEHIVKFVRFSEEQKPLLVMEYLPLGNLDHQHCQHLITEEETLQILHQGLYALEYLHSHSPPLAHRDIKPENILVQSRMPFVIKLADFGLAKNSSSFKTLCGSYEYAAPEIWGRDRYTASVDIWSLGVITLKYGYKLPLPSQKRKGIPWCRDITQKAEEGEGEGDTLMDLISTKMLRMDHRHRGSASECLEEVYRLGFHKIQNVDIGRTTLTGKTAVRGGVTRSKSVTAQPLQHAPSDRDVESGFYDIGGTSKSTVIAPSKRGLRDRNFNFYNRISQQSLQHTQGSTQIWNPQTDKSLTPTPSKRRQPQMTLSPTTDTSEEGRSKRSRVSVSLKAGEGPPEPSPISRVPRIFRQVVRKYTQNRTRSPLGKASAPAAEVGPGEVDTPPSKRKIHDNVMAMLGGNLDEGNLDGKDEGKAKVHHPQ